MDFAEIRESENKYAVRTGNRHNICFAKGEGCKLYDTNGKEYIDFVGGYGENTLGYSHPGLTQTISEQSQKLINCSNLYFSEPLAKLCKTLVEDTIFSKALICSGHYDAFFGLISFVRRYCQLAKDTRKTIVAVTENRYFNIDSKLFSMQDSIKETFNIRAVPYGDKEKLRQAFDGTVCAAIISPIMSDGVTVMDNDYVLSFYALAKSASAIVSIDESNLGFGCTGKTFAYEHYGINPDIVSLSKGLGGGLIMGALLLRRDIALLPTGKRQLTQASALECEAANFVISKLKGGMLDEVNAKGEYLLAKLSKLRKYNFVVDIRGKGLIYGIELSSKLRAEKVALTMEQHGFLIDVTAKNTLRLTPPFVVTEHEIDLFTDELARIFSETNI